MLYKKIGVKKSKKMVYKKIGVKKIGVKKNWCKKNWCKKRYTLRVIRKRWRKKFGEKTLT